VKVVRESGDRLGLITRRRSVRVRTRSCHWRKALDAMDVELVLLKVALDTRPDRTCGTERTAREGLRCIRSIAGLIGFDGSARQSHCSGSRPTALAQPGNLKCERHRSFRDGRVRGRRACRARGIRELERPGRRVTAPTRRTVRRDGLTRAGKDGALVEAAHAALNAGRRHSCTAWSDAGSTPAGSTSLTRPGDA
jgi:hypothetical protein